MITLTIGSISPFFTRRGLIRAPAAAANGYAAWVQTSSAAAAQKTISTAITTRPPPWLACVFRHTTGTHACVSRSYARSGGKNTRGPPGGKSFWRPALGRDGHGRGGRVGP